MTGDRRFETVAVHAGEPDDEFGPVTVPITLSSTFRTSNPGTVGPLGDYARSSNPTRSALETALTELERGAGAGAFASGMAAIDALLRLVDPASKVVVSTDVYGGTWRLLDTVWRATGMEADAVDLTDLSAARKAIKGASLVIAETPSNPLMRILDVAAIVEIAHDSGALVCIDNTFATPYLQQPLTMGADLVVHSATKYLGGHSDVVSGAVVARSPEHVEQLHYLQKAVGAVASPFDAYLVLRGIRTLAVRMDRQSESALQLARMLHQHPAVSSVNYPGLESDPGYALAQRQMRSPGGMVSFRHRDGAEAAAEVARRTRIFTLAEFLGAVESLIEIPAVMTHVSTVGSLLEVPADLVRLSVGIEHVDDLRADLEQAFSF